MQIEEAFRDAKNSRFGWAMDAACTARSERVEMMVLFAALASLLILVVGISAEGAGKIIATSSSAVISFPHRRSST